MNAPAPDALAGRVAGKRVLVTRPADAAAGWIEELRRLGAEPIARPCVETETLTANGAAARLRDALRACDWLVLTSARAVDALAEIAGDAPGTEAAVATVGPATADRARAAGLDVRLVAEGGSVADLAARLAGVLAGAASATGGALPRVLFAGAEDATPGLEILEAKGLARLDRIAVYRTIAAPALPAHEREALDVDVVLLASPSAVRGFVARARLPVRAHIVTIGPGTTAAARDAGLTVAGEARTRDLAGMLRAIPEEAAP